MDSSTKALIIVGGTVALMLAGGKDTPEAQAIADAAKLNKDRVERFKVEEAKLSGNPHSPSDTWEVTDLLIGIKENALELRKLFKDNEEFMTMIITSVFGPEAALGTQAIDEIADWILGDSADD